MTVINWSKWHRFRWWELFSDVPSEVTGKVLSFLLILGWLSIWGSTKLRKKRVGVRSQASLLMN
jgi:hypothetical protein